MYYSSVFRMLWTRLGFLGTRAIEFCDAAYAVRCVSELRAREASNYTKRTSDATEKAIQPETYLEVRPELRPDVRD